jgi:hypothetical protein
MAREGAFYAQFNPGRVDCVTGDDILGRAQAESPGTVVDVKVERRQGAAVVELTGCAATADPGDTIIVTVTTDMTIITPLVGAITGPEVVIGGFSEVTVQG